MRKIIIEFITNTKSTSFSPVLLNPMIVLKAYSILYGPTGSFDIISYL